MSNGNGFGICFQKRFLKDEERFVLCDIGYSVKNVYTSLAVSAPHTYAGGTCPGTNIWGINDGLVGTTYTELTVTNSKSIALSTILSNDLGANQVSCIEVVYANATAGIVGANLVVNGTVGQGMVLIKYLPKNIGSGKFGNATYIFVYFLPGACNPINACNMVQNGGFENISSGPCGGQMVNPVLPLSAKPKLSCWGHYEQNSSDLFSKPSCLANGGIYHLGVNTLNTPTAINCFNAGQRVVGLGVSPNTNNAPFGPSYEEDMKNNLSASLIPGTAYRLSLWAYSYSGPTTSSIFNPNKSPIVITCASAPNFAATGTTFPGSLNVLTEFTVNVNALSTSTLWTLFTGTFTFSGATPDNALILGLNPIKTASFGLLGSSYGYVFIDDVSLIPLPSPNFSIPNNVICSGTSFTNLAQYADPIPGTFTGPGVTFNNGQYDFNSPPTLTPGSYPIAFNYTHNGCSNTILQQVFIGGISSGTNSLFCNNNNYTLTALGYPASTTYTWLPSGQISPTTAISGTTTTSYTLLTNSNGCNQSVFTPTVIPNTIITAQPGPWCGNTSNPLGIAIPNFTVPVAITQTWAPSGLTVPVIFVNFTGPLNPIYTATTSVAGCTNIASYTATWTAPFTLSVTNTASTSCLTLGQSATLTAYTVPPGATYTWQPTGQNTNSIVVTPTVTTIYSVSATLGGCVNTETTEVVVGLPVTFTNLPTNWCKNQCVTYLEDYLAASTPTGGSWTGIPGIYSTTINTNSFVTGVCLSASLNIAPGTYTIEYAYAPPGARCTITNQFTVNVVQDFFVQATVPTPFCSNFGGTVAITAIAATAGPITYTWLPGPLIGQTQSVNPGVTTTYTVLASNGACTYSTSATMVVSNQCCSATNQFTASSINSGTFSGQYAINQDLTITGYVQFEGEFRVAPNVSITVVSGGTLTTDNRGILHMYACNNMWQGITVYDGGRVFFKSGDLFEDAKEAISCIGSTNTSTNVADHNLYLNAVAFNRNYISVAIKKYNQTTNNPPFTISSCVFTCRNLNIPVGATSWPNAVSLRATTGSTISLSSPFLLQGYSAANLKAPLGIQPSWAGVYVENSGITAAPTAPTATYYNIQIGANTSYSPTTNYFNLYDNLMHGIYSLNSNVLSNNNYFQNTRRFSLTVIKPKYKGGYGIYAINDDSYLANGNNYITTVAPILPNTFINRFWNCHYGIGAYNIFELNAQNCDFRSTQGPFQQIGPLSIGQFGIHTWGNRYKNYQIKNNKIQNINIGVYFYMFPGPLNIPSQPNYGQYLGFVNVQNNLFSPTTNPQTGFGQVNYGVYAASALNSNNYTFLEANAQLRIQLNNFDRVKRGIYIGGFNLPKFSAFSVGNTISVVPDIFTVPQFGINHSYNIASVANTNTIIGVNNSMASNTISAGIYFAANQNSGINCNDVSKIGQCFEFYTPNPGTIWLGNKMSNASRGLFLNTNGDIGQQGSTANAFDNQWLGSWLGNNGTWTFNTFAVNSKLFVRNVFPYNPPFNAGNPNQFSYIIPGVINTTPTTGLGPYYCNTGGPCTTCNPSARIDYLNALAIDSLPFDSNVPETQEIAKHNLYRNLEEETTLIAISSTLQAFYTNSNLTPRQKLYAIEKELMAGNLNLAATLLSIFTPTTNIESNYKLFYELQKKYMATGDLTILENLQLNNLAHKCPAIDGTVVYQARHLYGLVNETVITYNDYSCAQTVVGFGRTTSVDSGKLSLTVNKIDNMVWLVDIYPNPAENDVTINTPNEKEQVLIWIYDAQGKLLYNKTTNSDGYSIKLKLDLKNGIYFVNLVNEKGERTTRKLVISK